jgi:hypothetical protein
MGQLATLICIVFILYLFWADHKRKDGPSGALWVPLIWMFLAGSRYVSSWLNLSAPPGAVGTAVYDEGSPVDAAAFFLLIAAGVFILSKRKIDWEQLLIKNKWVGLYLLYCLVSVLWSDVSFVSFKRWFKDLGNPIMVLVILTEERPYEALGVLLRRLGFLWLPLSVLFVRFYPQLGRGYGAGGAPMYTGVGHQKNDLGLMCLISGIYYAWHFIMCRKTGFRFWDRDNIIDYVLLGMLVWLLHMSQSDTSITCAVVAASLFAAARVTSRQPGRIMTWGAGAASLYLVLDAAIGLKPFVLRILGRDPTLTGRTEVWSTLKQLVVNPLVGAGFMSFWSGRRMEFIWQSVGAGINQAHNGYLEQYLNLGYIGVAFILAIMLSGLLKVRGQLYVDYSSAVLMLCFIVTAALYNYTEASFYGINNMWLLTILAVIEVPRRQRTEAAYVGKRRTISLARFQPKYLGFKRFIPQRRR